MLVSDNSLILPDSNFLTPRKGAFQSLKFNNEIEIHHFAPPKKSGNRDLIDIYKFHNDITNIGINNMFDVHFPVPSAEASQITQWFFGVINSASYTAVAAADTMASHTGWIEFTNYSESTRPQWIPIASSGRTKTNTVTSNMTITAIGTLVGVFVTSGSAKSGTTGILWSTALYGSTFPVAIDDLLKINYAVSA